MGKVNTRALEQKLGEARKSVEEARGRLTAAMLASGGESTAQTDVIGQEIASALEKVAALQRASEAAFEASIIEARQRVSEESAAAFEKIERMERRFSVTVKALDDAVWAHRCAISEVEQMFAELRALASQAIQDSPLSRAHRNLIIDSRVVLDTATIVFERGEKGLLSGTLQENIAGPGYLVEIAKGNFQNFLKQIALKRFPLPSDPRSPLHQGHLAAD
ncbi:hypothetical protein [Paraburkholderia sp. Ac-20347]|uniref:hypothetical protein n=1 Tax=Paraburkholderia sp. Ac-20347 TaxID=2703892 RepID=UPI001980A0BA|nr:hypothetical protein [Paraburkholderia sp. Ac-20347]MBN3812231.1 hypothetical protein [Paraburkholderia sp. Ac-20347]